MNSLRRSWPLTEWTLLMVAAPFLLFPGPWSLLALPLVAVAWLLRWRASGHWRIATIADPWLALILLGAALGLAMSVDLPLSGNRATVLFLGWLLYESTVATVALRGLDRRWLAAFGAASLVIALMGFTMTDWSHGVLVPIPLVYDLAPQIDLGLPGSGVPQAGGLFNPRVVAGAAVLLAPLNAVLAFAGAAGLPRWQRWLHGLAALALALYIPLSQSPQGLLGLAGALLVLLLWRVRRAGRWLLLAAIAVALLAGVVALWDDSQWVPTFLAGRAGFGLESRFELWVRGLRMIQTAPLTGIGINNYAPVFDALYPGYILGPEAHAHNTLLQMATDSGLVALVGVLAWLGVAFWLGMKVLEKSSEQLLQATVAGALAGLTGWLAYGLLDSATLGHKVGVAVWVLLALVIGLAYAQGMARPRRSMWAAMAAMVVMAVALAWFTGYGIYNTATVTAQQPLLRPRPVFVDPTTSLALLDAAEQRLGARPHLYRLRALLEMQQEDYGGAAASFRQLVALETEEPLWLWAPAAVQRGELANAPPGTVEHAGALEVIYRHWFYRYPQRPEYVALLTFLYADVFDDPARAAKFLADAAQSERYAPAFLKALGAEIMLNQG